MYLFWICIKYEIIYIVQTLKNQVKYVSIVCIISTILTKLFCYLSSTDMKNYFPIAKCYITNLTFQICMYLLSTEEYFSKITMDFSSECIYPNIFLCNSLIDGSFKLEADAVGKRNQVKNR